MQCGKHSLKDFADVAGGISKNFYKWQVWQFVREDWTESLREELDKTQIL